MLMRIRLSLLIALALIAMVIGGCNKDKNEDQFFGSDNFITSITLGDVPIENGKTFNVPLSHISSIGFELARPVTPAALNGSINFSIHIENVDRGTTFLLTESLMDENGNITWLDGSNRRLEFRMTHPMNAIIAGGQPYTLGKLGDLFRIRIDYLTGVAEDGKPFSLAGDQFYVIWTESSAGPVI
jgi:hypothetical protein